jgi:hypothetical protein
MHSFATSSSSLGMRAASRDHNRVPNGVACAAVVFQASVSAAFTLLFLALSQFSLHQSLNKLIGCYVPLVIVMLSLTGFVLSFNCVYAYSEFYTTYTTPPPQNQLRGSSKLFAARSLNRAVKAAS